MARLIYFDCFSGAAGDMVLGALIDVGVPLEAIRSALGSLGLAHEIVVERVTRAGISANHVSVRPKGSPAPAPRALDGQSQAHDHHHGHGHRHTHVPDAPPSHGSAAGEEHAHTHHAGENGHRTIDEILHLIGHSALSEAGKARASGMFRRLAEAEAAIHAIPLSAVHLHEVGAVDSIIDIVGVVAALEWLGIDDIVASPLNVGGGTVTIAHGTYPVPAPATLRLLAGVPMYGGDPPAELVTPTGALIVSTYATSYGPVPAMTVDQVGYGAGTRDVPGRPNVLRVILGERAGTDTPTGDVVKIECAIDDMSPQLYGPAFDRLLAAGALDVYTTAVQMKKGRPGTLLTVLGRVADRQTLCDVMFRETTTLGVRFETMGRDVLDRTWVEVTLPAGPVRVKVASRGGAVLNAAPEFDDCARIAAASGQSVKAVQAEALRAWFARGEKGTG